MGIIEENNKLIEDLNKLLIEVNVEEIEKALLSYIDDVDSKIDTICDERVAFNLSNKVFFYLNRIQAINEILIVQHKGLNKRIERIKFYLNTPVSICNASDTLNKRVYVVQQFYKGLFIKRKDHSFNCLIIELKNGFFNLDSNELSPSEKIIGLELNTFLLYVRNYWILTMLIDFCLCVNCNYNEQKRD